MLEIVAYVLAGLSMMVLTGLVIALYVAWRDRRRAADAAAFLAPIEPDQTRGSGGGGGPKEQA